MAFDPDAYLASKSPAASTGGFDPDAYLGIKSPVIEQPKQSKLKLPSLFGVTRLGRVAQGIADPFIAINQGIGKALTAADIPYGEKLNRFYDVTNKGYEQQREEEGQSGIDAYRLGGNIVSPVTGLIAAAAPAAAPATLIGKVGVGAAQGSAFGLTTPVQDSSQDFLKEKGKQAAIGTVLGGALPVVGVGINKAIAPIRNRMSSAIPEYIAQYANLNPLEMQNAQREAKTLLSQSGIDYDSLTLQAQNQIDDYVAKSTAYKAPLTDLNQVARQAVLEANPIPIKGTKGQLTQDPIQQQQERMIADSPIFGGNVKDKLRDDQVKLIANLDKISESHGTKINSANEFGQLLRSFVSGKYKKTKAGVKDAYKLAEETTGNLPIELTPKQMAFFTENAGDATVGTMLSNAKNLGIIGTDETGKLIPLRTTFKNMQKLRTTASTFASGQGPQKYYGGALKSDIDDLVEQYGSDLYKNAIKLRRAQGLTYESGPKSISGILKKSTETDFAIPDEKIFNKVIVNGSLDDVSKLIGFAKDKGNGEQIKQIQAMTTNHLKDSAVSSDGLNVSWSALENAVNKMGGPAKLKVIYGDDKAREIMNLVESARILNKQQSFAAGGSQTYGRLQLAANSLLKLLNIVPGSEAVKATANAAMTASKSNNALSASFGNVKPKLKEINLQLPRTTNALVNAQNQ